MQDLIITFLASILIWFMFLGLFILWVIDGKIKKEQVLHALFAIVFAWILTVLIKNFFDVQRPFLTDGQPVLTLTKPGDYSFPSTHTAVAFALATTIYLHDKKNGLIFFWGAFLVAIGRILANVHLPSDTIIGAFFGVLIAWGVGRTHLFGLVNRK